jgi:hypothetical protein
MLANGTKHNVGVYRKDMFEEECLRILQPFWCGPYHARIYHKVHNLSTACAPSDIQLHTIMMDGAA